MSEHRVPVKRNQVAAFLLEGLQGPEIAREMGISLRSVRMHLNRLYQKHGIRNGVKRVKLAILLYRKENHVLTN